MNEPTPRLLVVDDDDDLRQVIARRLQRRGFSVQTATDGEDALTKINSEVFDLVLLDHNMPGLTGIDLLRLLRATHSQTSLPVVLLTAQSDSSNIVKALELGANDYITKPFDFDVAVARVNAQLERKRSETNLRDSEERYALASRAVNDGIWDWDLRRNRIYYSPQWKRILGYDENELSEDPEEWHGRVHADDRKSLMAAMDTHWRGETPSIESEHRLRHKDGSYRWVLCRGVAAGGQGMHKMRMAGSITDITNSKMNDPLTGLANRSQFTDLLARAIELYKSDSAMAFAVLFVDLDHFKWINDTMGHSAGDLLICQVALRLRECLPNAMAARMGGDHFAILLPHVSADERPVSVGERVRRALEQPYQIGDRPVSMTVSVGVTVASAEIESVNDVLRDADAALYRAKQNGRSRVELLDNQMRNAVTARLSLEKEVRQALSRDQIEVYFQPVVRLHDGQMLGVEALARWKHPERGLVSPADFIPIAEQTGDIIPIGAYILRYACATVRTWQDRFDDAPLRRLGVNVSARQLAEPGLAETVASVLKDTGLRPEVLHLEMTESALLSEPDLALDVLQQLKKLGVHLEIDDFGTGYSALSYLARYPLDGLKIDKSFTAEMDQGQKQKELVRSLIAMADVLDLDVVAEGVETKAQAGSLLKMGCAVGQGFFYCKPLSTTDMARALQERTPLLALTGR